MEMASILRRYVNHQVSIATFSHGRIVGFVATVHDDCVRLINTLTVGECEDTGWYAQMQIDDPDASQGLRSSETVIQFHCILSVTCLDEGIDLSEENAESEADSASPPTAGLVINSNVDSLRKLSTGLAVQDDAEASDSGRIEDALDRDPLALFVGVNLIKLASSNQAGELLDRISRVRKGIASEIGFLMPKVRVRDDISLDQNTYSICFGENEVARDQVFPDLLLALKCASNDFSALDGTLARDPAFGQPAKWIKPNDQQRAELLGCVVVQPEVVIATHLTEIVKQNAGELLTYDQVSQLVQHLRESSPAAVDEVIPQATSLAKLHYVLRRLLEERVSIRNLIGIVEALGQADQQEADLEQMVRRARLAIRRTICTPFVDSQRQLAAIRLNAAAERALVHILECQRTGEFTHETRALAQRLRKRCREIQQPFDQPLPVVVDDALRSEFWQLLNFQVPNIGVLAYSEIPRDAELDVVADLELEDLIGEGEFESVRRLSASSKDASDELKALPPAMQTPNVPR